MPFWRDLHAIPGALFSLVLLFLIVTGLPWSGFWGGNWDHVITRVEQGYGAPEPPVSEAVTAGDLDRFGNPIPWANQSTDVPESAAPDGAHAEHESDGDDHDMDDMGGMGGRRTVPPMQRPGPRQPIGLDAVATVADEEGMLAGLQHHPALGRRGRGRWAMSYGVYTIANPWPAAAVDERTVFVDQFSGATLAEAGMGDNGVLADATSIGIDTHMGTQFGVVNRIVMTLACLGVVWGAFSGLMMWWKRRPKRLRRHPPATERRAPAARDDRHRRGARRDLPARGRVDAARSWRSTSS